MEKYWLDEQIKLAQKSLDRHWSYLIEEKINMAQPQTHQKGVTLSDLGIGDDDAYVEKPADWLDEMVDHPDYYNWIDGLESWDVSCHFDHCSGAAIDYIWRAGKKEGNSAISDYKKAIKWLEKRIKLIESGEKI